MFTRCSMVKGLKYVSKTNTFKARLVFCDVDPKDKIKVIEQEEEMQVDGAWVRDESSKEDVQHTINLHTGYKLCRTLKYGLENTKLFEYVTLDLERAALLTVMPWQGI